LEQLDNPYEAPTAASARLVESGEPAELYSNKSFWGLTLTQFLGAFNDNVYKQILLLLFVAIPYGHEGKTVDLQGLAMGMFSAPFIFFSGYAGYLSDRFSKRRVIVVCKIAEIFIMSLGAVLFYLYAREGLKWWLVGTMATTLFCMGTHSAFFGPSKYAVMPEILREPDLPNANGLILMTTFLAIIFGTALAGGLKQYLKDDLWIAGLVCISISIIGTITSLTIYRVPPAIPNLKFDWSTVWIPQAIWQYFAVDRPLYIAVLVSSVFWGTASIVLLAINALGERQLKVTNLKTSLMVATISVGIAIGSVIAGHLSKQQFNTRVMKTGAWGLAICLGLMAIPAHNAQHHLLGYYGSVICLVVAGIFTGMFAVPLQTYMQVRPPKGLKGRMLATQNLLNWIGITLSSVLYYGVARFIEQGGYPNSIMFAITSVFMLGVAIFYHPRSEKLGEARSELTATSLS